MRGSCLCATVVFEVNGPLSEMSHCHCSMCRKAHGALFATYVSVAGDALRWVQGEGRLRHYESSPGFLRAFCGTCGSVVPEREPKSGTVFIAAGNLEDAGESRPARHIFAASMAPWHEITDQLPRYAEYEPGSGSESVPQPDRSSDAGAVRGSCLCDAVAFEYDGPPVITRHCHCGRCRRARSAAHATNVFVEPERFRWLRGESLVTRYDLPGAKLFGQAFCSRCGSPMPRQAPAGPSLNVPSGALDDDPGGRPAMHIFVGSKARWFEITDTLPCFEEVGDT